jgi:hypothetical protein
MKLVKELIESAHQSAIGAKFLIFSPLHPIGLRGWFQPARYDLFPIAIADSFDEAEKLARLLVEASMRLPKSTQNMVAILNAPLLPQQFEFNQKLFLVMCYSSMSLNGYPRESVWDARAVYAHNKETALRIAKEQGLGILDLKPIATLCKDCGNLPSVKAIDRRMHDQ